MRAILIASFFTCSAVANPMADREMVLGALVVALSDGTFIADAESFSSMEACETAVAEMRARLDVNPRVIGYVTKCGKVKVPLKSGA